MGCDDILTQCGALSCEMEEYGALDPVRCNATTTIGCHWVGGGFNSTDAIGTLLHLLIPFIVHLDRLQRQRAPESQQSVETSINRLAGLPHIITFTSLTGACVADPSWVDPGIWAGTWYIGVASTCVQPPIALYFALCCLLPHHHLVSQP